MKTLILNGSPRAGGDTAALLKAFTSALAGEYMVKNCFGADISPCTDCRACRVSQSCALHDDMQEIYRCLAECDNVVIASPVHYGELSSSLLSAAGRFQLYSSAMIFRHEKPNIAAKRGAVILAQGGSGGAERAYETAVLIFRSIGITEVMPMVCSGNTDRLPAAEDKAALSAAVSLAARLNG